jgi:urease accessory protein
MIFSESLSQVNAHPSHSLLSNLLPLEFTLHDAAKANYHRGMKILFTLLCLLPLPLFAHTGTSPLGFTTGLSHPVFGLDHLLAMLSVGILSAQIGGRAIWTVPLTFICFMLVGGTLGMVGIPFFSVEIAIALSVLLLGILIASNKKFPLFITMAGVGFFALFHGHAHGEEMPASAQPALYALGFVLGTFLIHLAGVFLGYLASKNPLRLVALRASGIAIAILGIYFLSQSIHGKRSNPVSVANLAR